MNVVKLYFLLSSTLFSLSVITIQAQIDKSLYGKWEFKEKSEKKDKKAVKTIHLVYEFKADSVIWKGYLNKKNFIVMKGKVVEAKKRNIVKVEYGRSLLNDVEDLGIKATINTLSIVMIDENQIRIKDEIPANEYSKEPYISEFVYKRVSK